MRNLAQAKAANACGQVITLRSLGVPREGISKLFLAGDLANYVDVRIAIETGFLATVPEDRMVKVGNATLGGAKQTLVSRRKRQPMENPAKRVEPLELETTPDFFDVFVEGCQFKPMPAAVGRMA